ncbi:MAG: carboxypeptidase regulatory-like domain-containing protein [Planctomycetaceae bacterium]|nr:carboxypeptidase regulatory-like domain-containing protein [Planctomycetaceae bacterium]
MGANCRAVVYGRVADRLTGKPVARATVRTLLYNGEILCDVTTRTNGTGRYRHTMSWAAGSRAVLMQEIWAEGFAYIGGAVRGKPQTAQKILKDKERHELSSQLTEGFDLVVTVRDPRGRPLSGCPVAAGDFYKGYDDIPLTTGTSRLPGGDACAVTDVHGQIVLRGLNAWISDEFHSTLRVRHARYLDHIQDHLQLLPRRDHRAALTVTLRPGQTLRGRITDAKTGRAVAGACVELSAVSGAVRLVCCGSEGKRTTTDAAGRYVISGLSPGLHHISVYHPRYPMHYSKKKVGPGAPPGDMKLRCGPVISGRVTDAAGNPVPGAMVEASYEPINPGGFNRLAANEKGEYLLAMRAARGRLHIHSYGRGPDQDRIYGYCTAPARSQTVDFNEKEMIPLECQAVHGSTGRPVRQKALCRCGVMPPAIVPLGGFYGGQDDGRIRLTLPPHGVFTIALSEARDFYNSHFFGRTRVTMSGRRKSRPIVVRVKPAQKLLIQVLDRRSGKPVTNAWVETRPLAMQWNICDRRATGSDGAYCIGRFPPFGARVRITAEGYRPLNRNVSSRVIAAGTVLVRLVRA